MRGWRCTCKRLRRCGHLLLMANVFGGPDRVVGQDFEVPLDGLLDWGEALVVVAGLVEEGACDMDRAAGTDGAGEVFGGREDDVAGEDGFAVVDGVFFLKCGEGHEGRGRVDRGF